MTSCSEGSAHLPIRYRSLRRQKRAVWTAKNSARDTPSCESDWPVSDQHTSPIPLLGLIRRGCLQVDDNHRWEDITWVLRKAQDIITEVAHRPNPARAIAMESEPVSEQDRYESLIYFYADQLGKAIQEFVLWEERTADTRILAQRRARGRERVPRDPPR